MKKIPEKLGMCPIFEAVFEIRFETALPSEAVVGIVYSAVQDFFPNVSIKSLPVQQIPEQIRLNDPNLKYKALSVLQNANFSFSIGPKVLVFSNNIQYQGWTKWFTFCCDLIDKISKTNLIKSVERVGLRYINFFNDNILKKTNIMLQLNDELLLDETSNLRTELKDGDFIKVLQVGNAVKITSNNVENIGSVIDIDCTYNWKDEDFFSTYKQILDLAHTKEKELFFSLLTDDFLMELRPEFKE